MPLAERLTLDPRAAAREKGAGEHLPYLAHVDDVTLETRDGLLMQTIRLGGFLFETSDTAELNYRAELRDAMMRAVGSSQFAIYHHVLRRRAEDVMEGEFPDQFSRTLDRRWRERLSARKMYVNDLFLTIVRRPMQGRVGLLDRARTFLTRQVAADRAAQRAGELRSLHSATQALTAALGQYSPHVLSVYDTPGGYRSEPLEFLSYLYNAEMRPIALPHGPVNDYLPARRVSFGHRAFERDELGGVDRSFGAIVSIKDYPTQTMPGMFDELYRMPFEMVVTQSFAFVERGEALREMNYVLRRMRSTDDEALSLRDDLTNAKDDVAAGRAGFGQHHATIAVHADSLEELDREVAEIIAALADLGVVGVREEIALEPSFWAQFPGNFKYIPRKGLVSTRNFAGLASLHNFPVGQAQGNHWGDAITLFETTAAGPYFFSFHLNDLGNFTVIGPSGSGKTVVLNFLLAQARKINPRIIFFDKDRGAELFVRAIGGQYDRLRPGISSDLNPLQIEDTPANRQFLVDWLTLLAGGANTEEAELISDAVDTNFEQADEHRRLRNLVELLRGQTKPKAGDLYSRMKPWWGEGKRAWLFDNEIDRTDLAARTIGFDITALLDDPVERTPALLYFFHRVEERLDGSPTIIVVDEGWKALDDEVFVRRIKDWEKTVRKRNGIVGFATQSARDALESQIASAIIEQAAVQIFMVNPKAREEDYIDGFGLTPHELELVRKLPDQSHCFLIKRGNESVVARLNLEGEKDMLTILSGRESTVRVFDELVKETGTDPEGWLAPLMERV
ncbi:VirB4 family type IV secretion/conjugal transfer ATPase [Qipengyuania aurantiaca]|uniref:Type IV secretion system protein virB4 n=1 Tax=Qipengyuania aurantiaca TaxID=2867233 RepID=A0ABX8ZL88_9SPHN|nr:VirB4 family type IV secretion/conjugal transfer ATPase [Qipengyuania aurantiaca]QZD88894.1 VirB4 family type IV secretion/conjugal transfer ATPase [Qipengyuania aurantiaca]